jgi:excinuclease ABC subunit A
LGPEGGNKGGEIVAEGTPEQVAEEVRSYMGQYLKPLLAKSASTDRGPAIKLAKAASKRQREAAE